MTKFHCRRQFGMNFGNVTENEVNSNGYPHDQEIRAL